MLPTRNFLKTVAEKLSCAPYERLQGFRPAHPCGSTEGHSWFMASLVSRSSYRGFICLPVLIPRGNRVPNTVRQEGKSGTVYLRKSVRTETHVIFSVSFSFTVNFSFV